MWETANGHMVVRVKWFYHPEETQGCPNLKYPVSIKYLYSILIHIGSSNYDEKNKFSCMTIPI